MLLTPVGIQKRIVTAIIGTALLIFAVFCLWLALYRQSLMQSRIEQFLTRNAKIISAAVYAGDKNRTLQVLQSYKSDQQVVRVDVIQPDGSTLATYPPGNSPLDRAAWNRPDGTYLAVNTAEVVSSFPAGSARPSRVFIRMTLAVMKQRERQILVQLTSGVLLILVISAFLQFVLLKRWVLSPLGQLAAIAESAGTKGDYSRRMPAHDRDEFGQLGKSFNALLTAVEQREAALHQQHSLLEGTLQSTADGILAVSIEGRVTSYNRQFLELWHVPKSIVDADDTNGLADYILKQLSNPSGMQRRTRHFNDASKADTFDTLEFNDGRVFERFSRPQLVGGRVVGR